MNFENAEEIEPVMQTSPIDYEELLESFHDENSLQQQPQLALSHFDDKRFLGKKFMFSNPPVIHKTLPVITHHSVNRTDTIYPSE